jgi:hypothetical protein
MHQDGQHCNFSSLMLEVETVEVAQIFAYAGGIFYGN